MLLITLAMNALASSIFLIPILLAVNLIHTRDMKRTLQYYMFSLYLCIVYELVGPPNITYMNWDPGISWIPIVDMVHDLRSTVLNVVMFLPLGAALPLLWSKYRELSKTMIFGVCVTAAIELSQLFSLRATDINDLITNTLGTFIGYLLAKPFFSKIPAKNADSPTALLILSCAIMFFVEPFLFNWLYYLVF